MVIVDVIKMCMKVLMELELILNHGLSNLIILGNFCVGNIMKIYK